MRVLSYSPSKGFCAVKGDSFEYMHKTKADKEKIIGNPDVCLNCNKSECKRGWCEKLRRL